MSELARRQEELVRALVANGSAPDGLDPAVLSVAAAALLRKRTRSVARLLPTESSVLGDRFATVFADWATGRTRCDSLSEARAFLEHLYSAEHIDRPRARRRRFTLRRGSWP